LNHPVHCELGSGRDLSRQRSRPDTISSDNISLSPLWNSHRRNPVQK